MTTNLESYKKDLAKLLGMGDKMLADLEIQSLEKTEKLNKKCKELKDSVKGCFEKDYQRWYTESHSVIRQLIPDRLQEFEVLYKGDAKRKDVNEVAYTIQDWMLGISSALDRDGDKIFNDIAIVYNKCKTQLLILETAESRFESTLHDLKQIVQADLFDSELEATRELLKSGFLRGAGAIAGVVLEKHLAEVCVNHSIKSKKRHPTISDFNELLKKNDVIDVPDWRFIQRLGDLRNLCDHNKEKAPTKGEVGDLISGVDKVSKTID